MTASLDAAGVREYAPMRAVIASVRDAMIAKYRGEFELPQRQPLGGGDVLVMPLFHRPTGTSITKILSLDARRDPFIVGAIVRTANGESTPLVADAVTVTTLRTGAISAVAADLLSDPDASAMTLFGAGAQAFDQVMAIATVRHLRTLTIVDRTLPRAQALADRLRAHLPDAQILATQDPGERLRASDIVCCVTTAKEPLFDIDALGPEACVLAVGGYRPDMLEVPAELLRADQPTIVDDIHACMEESGEVISALKSGRITEKNLLPLGLALQDKPALTGRRLFKTVGIAVEDWAVMQVLSDRLVADLGETSL